MIFPATDEVYLGLKQRIDHGDDDIQRQINDRCPLALRFSVSIDEQSGNTWWLWVVCPCTGVGYTEELIEFLIKTLGRFPKTEILDRTTITTSWGLDVATDKTYPSCFVSIAGADEAIVKLIKDILIQFIYEKQRGK